jgi:ribonuclease P protein component
MLVVRKAASVWLLALLESVTKNSSEGFPKSIRIRNTRDYRRIQGRGKKLRTRNLLIIYCPSSLGESRFGVTVSKKVGNAVTRNLVKRWLRESIRRNQARYTASRPLDVVFIASPKAAKSDFTSISDEVNKALNQLLCVQR